MGGVWLTVCNGHLLSRALSFVSTEGGDQRPAGVSRAGIVVFEIEDRVTALTASNIEAQLPRPGIGIAGHESNSTENLN